MDETTYQLHRAIAAWIQAGGVFVAVAVFLVSVVRSRLQSRLRVYEAGHEGWMQFLKIAVEHPDLRLLDPDATRGQERPQKDREVERAAYLTLLAVLQREYFLSNKTGQRRKSSTLLVQFASTYVTDPEFMAAFAVSKFLYRQDFIQWLEDVASGVPDAKGVTDRSTG
jgi:hypothetical protein